MASRTCSGSMPYSAFQSRSDMSHLNRQGFLGLLDDRQRRRREAVASDLSVEVGHYGGSAHLDLVIGRTLRDGPPQLVRPDVLLFDGLRGGQFPDGELQLAPGHPRPGSLATLIGRSRPLLKRAQLQMNV